MERKAWGATNYKIGLGNDVVAAKGGAGSWPWWPEGV